MVLVNFVSIVIVAGLWIEKVFTRIFLIMWLKYYDIGDRRGPEAEAGVCYHDGYRYDPCSGNEVFNVLIHSLW